MVPPCDRPAQSFLMGVESFRNDLALDLFTKAKVGFAGSWPGSAANKASRGTVYQYGAMTEDMGLEVEARCRTR